MMNSSLVRTENAPRRAATHRATLVAGHGARLLFLCLLAAIVSHAQTAKPTPTPAVRRPLPKLSNGARGFDAKKKSADASARLIAVGGGWGAEEAPKPHLKSKTAQGYYKLGKAYLENIEFSKAIPPLERAVKMNPNFLAAYDALGYAYAYDGVESESEAEGRAFDAQALAPNEEKRFRQAIGAFEQARRLAPRRAYLSLNLGVLYFNTGQYQKAVDAFAEGLRLGPQADALGSIIPLADDSTLAVTYGHMGQAYEQLGQSENAVKAYEQALAIKGDEDHSLAGEREEIYLSLAQFYEKLGQPDKALENYQKLVAESQRRGHKVEAEVYLNLGALYADRQQYAEAADLFNKAANIYAEQITQLLSYAPDAPSEKAEWQAETDRVKADFVQAAYNLGVAELNLNQMEKAVETFKLVVEADPGNADARFNLGFAHLKLGDKKSAGEQSGLLKALDAEMAAELAELINR